MLGSLHLTSVCCGKNQTAVYFCVFPASRDACAPPRQENSARPGFPLRAEGFAFAVAQRGLLKSVSEASGDVSSPFLRFLPRFAGSKLPCLSKKTGTVLTKCDTWP